MTRLAPAPSDPSVGPLSDEYQEILTRHATSFRWAQLFLRPAERRDCAIAYAFCRLVDDAVDEASSPPEARRALDEYQGMLLGQLPRSPLVHDYAELAERSGFGLAPAIELLRGARSDLGVVRLATDAELHTYCYRVAGTVGLMMSGILGVRSPDAARHAVDLGIAMQLTNICRDVREDAERGRVYLPQARLAAVGLTPRDLLEPRRLDGDPALRARLASVVDDLLEQAESFYASGERGFVYLSGRARLAITVAAHLYRGIGRRLRRARGSDPWSGRVRVGPLEKSFLTARAFWAWSRGSKRRLLAPRVDEALALKG